MPVEPLTAVGTSINATFRLADFCLSVQRAPEDITIFSQLIKRVGVDRAEALQDFNDKESLLDSNPRKKEWITGIITDTNRVLERIGETVENARIDGVKGRSVTFQHRLEWVFSKKERVLMLQHWLSTCHQSLLAAISYMQSLQPLSTSQIPAKMMECKDEGDGNEEASFLQSPYSRRPRKSPSQLLEIAPPTYSRTLSEDLERAFRAVEALSLSQEGSLQQQQPPFERRRSDPQQSNHASIAQDSIPNDINQEASLAVPNDLARRSSVDDRRRRREIWLQHGET